MLCAYRCFSGGTGPPREIRGSYEQGSRYEQSGGDRTRGHRCVRCVRDSGGAGTQPLGGSRIRMDDDATAFALCLYLWRQLSRFEAAYSFKRVEGSSRKSALPRPADSSMLGLEALLQGMDECCFMRNYTLAVQ